MNLAWKNFLPALSLLLVVSGCVKSAPDRFAGARDSSTSARSSAAERSVRASGINDTLIPPESKEELVARFRAAHEDKDLAAMNRLIWGGANNSNSPRSMLGDIQLNFGHKIRNVYIAPATREFTGPYHINGETWEPVLPVVGNLTVEYDPESTRQIETKTERFSVSSSTYMVGEQSGCYMLSYRVRVH